MSEQYIFDNTDKVRDMLDSLSKCGRRFQDKYPIGSQVPSEWNELIDTAITIGKRLVNLPVQCAESKCNVEFYTEMFQPVTKRRQVINQVGSVVRLKVPLLNNSIGAVGICYQNYDIYSGAFIFTNGEYDGFSPDEQAGMLEYVGFATVLRQYVFQNVMKLRQDYEHGIFSNTFIANYSKLEIPRKTIRFRGRD